tara:strand:- start:619 stop:903 length:285 start_codon:yes stop_codon:yes gene_type:complete
MNDDVSYFEADDYEDKYMEVALTDAEDNEYIYWVSLDLISEDEDNEDIAIKIAKAKHSSLKLPDIPEDDENFEPKAVAYPPFSRDGDEFTFIKE